MIDFAAAKNLSPTTLKLAKKYMQCYLNKHSLQEEYENLSEQVKKLREKEELENLRRVNHEDEEELEDYCEIVDNTRAVQDLVDTVDKEKLEQTLVNKVNDKEYR